MLRSGRGRGGEVRRGWAGGADRGASAGGGEWQYTQRYGTTLCFFFLPGIRSIVVVLIVVVVVDVTVVVVVGVGVGGGACIETNTRRRALRYVRTPGHIK